MWRKLAERDAMAKRNNYYNCPNNKRSDPQDASIDDILAFIEGEGPKERQEKKKKKKKKKRKKGPRCKNGCSAPFENTWDSAEEQKTHCKIGNCDCRAVVAQGREAIISMLRKGMDFSPLFKVEEFETGDLNCRNRRNFAFRSRCKDSCRSLESRFNNQ